MWRKVCFTTALLAASCGVVCWAYTMLGGTAPDDPGAPRRIRPRDMVADYLDRLPVPLNRGAEVADGFSGDVHPALHGQGEMEVTAAWDYSRFAAYLEVAPPDVRELFRRLEVAVPAKTYAARDFSRFLPPGGFGAVGQLWAVDQDRVAEFLKQFHPAPSMRLIGKGRRAGPNGAFAVLRAVSASHVDILLRVHAEFDVMPPARKRGKPAPEAWFSPACFLGRLVIDRREGRVEFFRLGVPTDNVSNAHLTHATGDGDSAAHDWLRVRRMELTGGDPRAVDHLRWDERLDEAEALDRLAKVFYRFKQIDWVPFEKVQEIARRQGKPLLIVSAQGALDNQTC